MRWTSAMSHRTVTFLALAAAALPASVFAGDEASLRQTPIVKAVKRTRPSVVDIHSQKTIISASGYSNVAPTQNKLSGMGTGVIVDERGYIVTNYHVIEDVTSIRASLVDGSTYSAKVVARDPDTDLAILKIEPSKALPIMPMGTSSDLMQGEPVIAIGNAFGYERTITSGIISELHRDVRLSAEQAYHNLIQTDASINPGNSGGPLINADGRMIGLNVAIRAGAQGIGFAIPVDEVKQVIAKLINTRTVNGTWHGIVAADEPLSEDAKGKLSIRAIEPNSPALQAGLKAGDRILKVGPNTVQSVFDLERSLFDRPQGEQVPFVVRRDGREERVSLKIQSVGATSTTPRDVVFKKFGIRLGDSSGGLDVRKVSTELEGGLLVLEVAQESPASRAGIVSGDILVGMQDWATTSMDNVIYVLQRLQSDQKVRFFIVRENQLHRGFMELPREVAMP